MPNSDRNTTPVTERRPGIEPSPDDLQSACEIKLRACELELSALLNLAQGLAGETDSASLLRRALEYGTKLLGFEGTGLGLAIVRSLVREMGGTIRVESRLGQGTAFQIAFRKPSEV